VLQKRKEVGFSLKKIKIKIKIKAGAMIERARFDNASYHRVTKPPRKQRITEGYKTMIKIITKIRRT